MEKTIVSRQEVENQVESDVRPGASFSLGVENSPEIKREIRFALAHRYASTNHDDDNFLLNGSGFLNDEDEDDVLQIQRIDSQDVVYEPKKRKCKFLGKYLMGDLLGEGSYAKVKEVIDTDTLFRRAVKIMKRKKLRKIPHGEANVEREIRLLRRLKHRNVMELIDVFYNEQKGKIYMILEYCCAVLKDMLESSPYKKFPPSQAHFYFKQLIKGLEYLHSQRVVHKDIKPGNLLLNTMEVLKIADFGVAESLDLFEDPNKAQLRLSQGTPAFQSPEIANGLESFPAYKVDVWSAGVTLYNFVTGEYPFEGETIFRLFEAIGKGTFSFPVGSCLDSVLKNMIEGMLTKNVDQRLSVSDVLNHDWMKKKHPITSTHIPMSSSVAGEDENGIKDPDPSTSLVPYLVELHLGELELEDDQEENNSEKHFRKNSHIKNERSQKNKDSKTTKCLKQEGHLCAQHCLNALLQGPYYTAVDLSALSQLLDNEERSQYESATSSSSQNMDDTGFFSLQVLSRALQVWELELVSYSSSDHRAQISRAHPETQKAYICNFGQHWFTIRKIANQWLNLNSMLTYPELLTPSYLTRLLEQLRVEGYFIFVVFGNLPHCPAEDILRVNPVVQTQSPPLLPEFDKTVANESDHELQRAMQLSQAPTEDFDLQQALKISQTSNEDIELKRALELSQISDDDKELQEALKLSQTPGDDQELQKAISMSLAEDKQRVVHEKTLASGKDKKFYDSDMELAVKLSCASSKKELKPESGTTSSRKNIKQAGEKRDKSGNMTASHEPQASAKPIVAESSSEISQFVDGQKLGGDSSDRKSTPDLDEVRLKRLAFLEKSAPKKD